jgi:hypothetical protein
VAVDASHPGVSIRYSSIYLLQMAQRRFVDATNLVIGSETPTFIVQGTGQPIAAADPSLQFYSPIALNQIDPTRLLIGTSNLYESLDRGDTLLKLGTLGAPVGGNTFGVPLVYGGRRSGVDNPDVLYAGAGSTLFMRSSAQAPLTPLAAYPGGDVVDIVLDPADWSTSSTPTTSSSPSTRGRAGLPSAAIYRPPSCRQRPISRSRTVGMSSSWAASAACTPCLRRRPASGPASGAACRT